MSALAYGSPCQPSVLIELPGMAPVRTAEPTHEGCPGGYSLPGVIGGWSCPCKCHHRVTTAASEATP